MALSIEQYLTGKVDFNVSEATLAAILFDRGVEAGSAVTVLTEKQRDLCLADLYMYLAVSSTSKSGEYESDGGWQRQRSAKNVVDRAALRAAAQDLYKKWEDAKADLMTGKVKVSPIYHV